MFGVKKKSKKLYFNENNEWVHINSRMSEEFLLKNEIITNYKTNLSHKLSHSTLTYCKCVYILIFVPTQQS